MRCLIDNSTFTPKTVHCLLAYAQDASAHMNLRIASSEYLLLVLKSEQQFMRLPANIAHDFKDQIGVCLSDKKTEVGSERGGAVLFL